MLLLLYASCKVAVWSRHMLNPACIKVGINRWADMSSSVHHIWCAISSSPTYDGTQNNPFWRGKAGFACTSQGLWSSLSFAVCNAETQPKCQLLAMLQTLVTAALRVVPVCTAAALKNLLWALGTASIADHQLLLAVEAQLLSQSPYLG